MWILSTAVKRHLITGVSATTVGLILSAATPYPVSRARSLPSTAVMAIPETRYSWESTRLGRLDSLEQVSAPVPELREDEVMIGVRAIGLNFADIFCCLGLYEAANKELEERNGGSFCPGLEFAGDVLSVGSAVAGVKQGDRVFGFTRFGSYRSIVVTKAVYTRPVPAGWTYAEAAALLAQGLTAWHGLVPLGAARKGSRVLIHSAAGGVGCAAMQICTSLGCEVNSSPHPAASVPLPPNSPHPPHRSLAWSALKQRSVSYSNVTPTPPSSSAKARGDTRRNWLHSPGAGALTASSTPSAESTLQPG